MAEMENDSVCICKKPYMGEFMVQCDGCQIWYHPECLGYKGLKGVAEVEKMNPFLCKFCVEKGVKVPPRPAEDDEMEAEPAGPKKKSKDKDKSSPNKKKRAVPPAEPAPAAKISPKHVKSEAEAEHKKKMSEPSTPAAPTEHGTALSPPAPSTAKPITFSAAKDVKAPPNDRIHKDASANLVSEALLTHISEASAKRLAVSIIDALFAKYGSNSVKRLKDLLLPNIKRNRELVLRIESNEVTPEALILMDADALASQEVKYVRQQIRVIFREMKSKAYEELKAQVMKNEEDAGYVYHGDSGFVKVVGGKIESSTVPAPAPVTTAAPEMLPPTTAPIISSSALSWTGLMNREGDEAFVVSLRYLPTAGSSEGAASGIPTDLFVGLKKLLMNKKLRNDYFRKHVQQLRSDRGPLLNMMVFEVSADDEAKSKSLYNYLVERDCPKIPSSFICATNSDSMLNILRVSERQRNALVYVIMHVNEPEPEQEQDVVVEKAPSPKASPAPVPVEPIPARPYNPNIEQYPEQPPAVVQIPMYPPMMQMAPPGAVPINVMPVQPPVYPPGVMPPPPGVLPMGVMPPNVLPPGVGYVPYPTAYQAAPYSAPPPPQQSSNSLLGAGPANTLRH